MLRFLGHQQKCGGLGKRMAAKKGFRTSSLCRSYNDDEQPRSLSGDQKKPRKPRLQKTGGKKFKATSTVAVAVKGGGEREQRQLFFCVIFHPGGSRELKNLEVTFYRDFLLLVEEASVAQGQSICKAFFLMIPSTQRRLYLVFNERKFYLTI